MTTKRIIPGDSIQSKIFELLHCRTLCMARENREQQLSTVFSCFACASMIQKPNIQ